MAIDYPTLFADIATFITSINQIRDTAIQLNSPRPDLVALEQDHQDVLTATTGSTPRGRFSVLSGVDDSYVAIKDTFIAQCDVLAAYITDRLLDPTVVDNLPNQGAGVSIERVLVELYNDMLLNNQMVLRSTVSIGAASFELVDNGDPSRATKVGKVFLTKRLDGETAPGSDLANSVLYAGRDSELVVEAENLIWTCTGDQYDSGTGDGGENWQLETAPLTAGGRFTWRPEGSGESQNVSTFNSFGTLLANQDFEIWTDATTPTSWTIEAGTVTQQNAPSSTVFRGESALQFDAGGKISQEFPNLQPRTMYVATIAYKGQASSPLTMKFEGTLANGNTYVAAGEELLDTIVSNDWQQAAIFYLVPDQPMADAKLTVEAGGLAWIDSMTLGVVQWIGGVGACVVAGELPWITGDRITVPLSNDDAGKFQQLWRKFYRRQLPSSQTPTITEPTL